MPQYRVTVRLIPEQINPLPGVTEQEPEKEVYAQSFSDTDFDLNTLVLALNKRRRVRKARGKEAN